MNVASLLHREPETLPASASCAQAARRMRDAGVGSVIVAEDERPIGVVTDRDLAVRVLAERIDPERTTLAQIMSPRPIFVSEDADLASVVELMRDLSVRRIPVIDARRKLCGVVALDDVVLALVQQLGAVADAIRKGSCPAR